MTRIDVGILEDDEEADVAAFLLEFLMIKKQK